MKRIENLLIAFCLACWVVVLLAAAGIVDVSGRLNMSLRQLYAISAATGWVFGNVWVHRTRPLSRTLARRFFVIYFFGPPGVLYLLRALAPPFSLDLDRAAIIPMLSFFVYGVLFLVPVVLRRKEVSVRQIRIGSNHDDREEVARRD